MPTSLTNPYPSTQYGGVSGPVPERVYAPVADNVLIMQGSLVQVQLSTGYAFPAGTANTADTSSGYITIGRATQTYDNTVTGHAAAAFLVEVAQGAFLWDNAGSGTLSAANTFSKVYAYDDHTVGSTSTDHAYAGFLIGFSNDATARPIVVTLAGMTN